MTKAEFIKANGAPFQGESDLAIKILGFIHDTCLKNGGKQTVAAVNALDAVLNTLVVMTDGGSLTAGTDLTVTAGDVVVFDGTSWVMYVNIA